MHPNTAKYAVNDCGQIPEGVTCIKMWLSGTYDLCDDVEVLL